MRLRRKRGYFNLLERKREIVHCIVDRDRQTDREREKGGGGGGGKRLEKEKKGVKKSQICLKNKCVLKKKYNN